MVLFGRKRHPDRRELLASMDQMAVGKPVDNGEFRKSLFCFHCKLDVFTVDILYGDVKDAFDLSISECWQNEKCV
jgi:hypothetical protein